MTRTLQAANGPDRWVSPDGMIDLRLGDWREVLADVEACDAVITDPPYSERTHRGHDYTHAVGGGKVSRRKLGYGHLESADVREVVSSWSVRTRGWIAVFCDDVLAPAWKSALEGAGRYAFAPLPWYCPGSRVRLAGDGPSSWTTWIVVARPRNNAFKAWGTLPGGYDTRPEACDVVGGKPVGLMRAIVRDYTRPGDLVVDPFCGGATTAIACRMEGRRCITSERDPETFAKALARCQRGVTPDLFAEVAS